MHVVCGYFDIVCKVTSRVYRKIKRERASQGAGGRETPIWAHWPLAAATRFTFRIDTTRPGTPHARKKKRLRRVRRDKELDADGEHASTRESQR